MCVYPTGGAAICLPLFGLYYEDFGKKYKKCKVNFDSLNHNFENFRMNFLHNFKNFMTNQFHNFWKIAHQLHNFQEKGLFTIW